MPFHLARYTRPDYALVMQAAYYSLVIVVSTMVIWQTIFFLLGRVRTARLAGIERRVMEGNISMKEAEDHLRELTSRAKPSPDEGYIGGYILHHILGRHNEAEGILRDVLDMDPGHTGALNTLGLIMVEKGDFDEAKVFLGKASDIDPSDPGPLTNLGIIAAREGRFADAKRLLSAATEADNDDLDARINLGNLLAMIEDYEGARRELSAARALAPNDPSVLYFLASIEMLEGNNEEGLRLASKSIDSADDFSAAHYLKALLLERLGRSEEAEVSRRRALDLDPTLEGDKE